MHNEQTHALGALYAAHHGWLLRVLRKKLGWDMTQDTFMKVLVSQASFVLQEPRAFLTTVAHGLVVHP